MIVPLRVEREMKVKAQKLALERALKLREDDSTIGAAYVRSVTEDIAASILDTMRELWKDR